MARKCFISFKTEDLAFKKAIQSHDELDIVDKSLDEPIESDNEEYIMRKIREDYLSDSTVTIHLIGKYSAESLGKEEQRYIKRELQASLYHGVGNTQNGILGVVLPQMTDKIYQGSITCTNCGSVHTLIAINDYTVVKEFSYNYYIPNAKCAWSESDRFCVLVKWDDFIKDPNSYIEMAFQKRCEPIAEKTKVRP
ncbi:MAG: molecular chaperone Tir [Sphingobacteriaceae bacterium]|nr:molecular chaperone Tir [Sphingobacteriaceae bacterium]